MPGLSVEGALCLALGSIERAASLLWELDENRLCPGVDYELDLQHRANTSGNWGACDSTESQAAPRRLFKYISKSVWDRPTYRVFRRLLAKHDHKIDSPKRLFRKHSSAVRCWETDRRGSAAYDMEAEVALDTFDEEEYFLDAICQSTCMKFVFQWLSMNTALRVSSMGEFRALLKKIWFTVRATRSNDCTGFKHVFCGEVKSNGVRGLHSFVQIFRQERYGRLSYMGYHDIPGRSSTGLSPRCQQMLTFRFKLCGYHKDLSSMFVGVSPEFEFSLYSLLSLVGLPELVVNLGPYESRIKTVQADGVVCTAYPQLLSVDWEDFDDLLPWKSDCPAVSPDLIAEGNAEDVGWKSRMPLDATPSNLEPSPSHFVKTIFARRSLASSEVQSARHRMSSLNAFSCVASRQWTAAGIEYASVGESELRHNCATRRLRSNTSPCEVGPIGEAEILVSTPEKNQDTVKVNGVSDCSYLGIGEVEWGRMGSVS